MSITIPSELEWLGWIAGSDWPDGDEDKMWAIAADWRKAAADIRDLLPDLAAAQKATIDSYPWGVGVEAITASLDKLDHGPESLRQLADVLDMVAESADALAAEIQYTKILVISSLAMLAVEIIAAWAFPPTAPLVEAAAIAATRLAVRLLGQRAVSAIARFAAKTGIAAVAKFTAKHVVISTVLGAGQDLAIQAYQVREGIRDGIDWNRVGTTAYTAAAAGVVGGPAGGLLGKAAAKVPLPSGRWAGAVKGAAVGASSGMIGAVGAWGVGGFANGWTWDPRLLTSGTAYGVLTGGSKGFRHASPGKGPTADRFTATPPAHFGSTSDGSAPPVRPASAGDPVSATHTTDPATTAPESRPQNPPPATTGTPGRLGSNEPQTGTSTNSEPDAHGTQPTNHSTTEHHGESTNPVGEQHNNQPANAAAHNAEPTNPGPQGHNAHPTNPGTQGRIAEPTNPGADGHNAEPTNPVADGHRGEPTNNGAAQHNQPAGTGAGEHASQPKNSDAVEHSSQPPNGPGSTGETKADVGRAGTPDVDVTRAEPTGGHESGIMAGPKESQPSPTVAGSDDTSGSTHEPAAKPNQPPVHTGEGTSSGAREEGP
uniref:WXG100-like domain-containing protein n=1 Tax=Nocardia altamirensis TaxID=472158 RepID=UPI000B1B9400